MKYQKYLQKKEEEKKQLQEKGFSYEELEDNEDSIATIQVQEISEIYSIEDTSVNNEHDKIFRRILDDKNEASKFINKALNLKVKIAKEQIEKYNSSFVTIKLKNQEADIIYKMKNKNIFFLIEHQTKIDYAMPLRILEYEYEIIKSAIDKTKLGQKNYKFPRVIPIVLYSGKKKWNVKNYISKVQEQLESYQSLEFAKYNIVDVNDYTEEELLKEESFLSKAMLIEKTIYTKDFKSYLNKIVEKLDNEEIYNNEQKELLITIINLVLRRKLNNEETQNLIEKLKGGSKSMLAVEEAMIEENRKLIAKGEKRGIKKGKLETAKNLLKNGISIEVIIEATGLRKEEIIANN